jgi:hypothetical protein
LAAVALVGQALVWELAGLPRVVPEPAVPSQVVLEPAALRVHVAH